MAAAVAAAASASAAPSPTSGSGQNQLGACAKQASTPPPDEPTPSSPDECVTVMPCHGLADLTCGPAGECTEAQYLTGDICRQWVARLAQVLVRLVDQGMGGGDRDVALGRSARGRSGKPQGVHTAEVPR